MGANGVEAGRASRLARWTPALILAIVALAALALAAMGRSAICPCGHIDLWHGSVRSDQNSQQLFDWYSLSHVVHGLLFYAAGWLALRRWPWRARLVAATLVEAAWEVVENSPFVIDRYRAVTMAWGYSGDSIVNAVADIGCMIAGFMLARRLPVWGGFAVAVALELVALYAIRDNLVLNVLMLVAPVEAIRIWQAG